MWDHDPQGDGTSYGDEYPYHTRAEMKAGGDAIDGAAGTDRAIFTGLASEYHVETAGSETTVTDTVHDRDGTDVLRGIETLVFRDRQVGIAG